MLRLDFLPPLEIPLDLRKAVALLLLADTLSVRCCSNTFLILCSSPLYVSYIFRKAFQGLLPDDILWRRKEAFSDGVSGHTRSWFQIIREHVDKKITDEEYFNYNRFITSTEMDANIHNRPYDAESYYYRSIFDRHYAGWEKTIPYFWRHPFCEEKDPSARLLTCYKNTDV